MLTYIGLTLIILAWIYQLIKAALGNTRVQPVFVGGYVVGALLLVMDGFMVRPLPVEVLLNLLSAAVALGVLFVTIRRVY